MKGREGKGPPSTDLLVCFPSRAHLTLMPKPICSPARPSESSKRHHNHQHHHAKHLHHHHHPHLKKSSNRSGAAGQASPLLWAKTKPITKDISEPTSPKVTCAGQIKVRSKPAASSCKNWQSVMEEIERLHNNRKHKKRPAWFEALGFKKDVMQFLTCLRNIRFDFRCFGSFPASGITSDDEEDDEDDDEDYQEPRISREANDDKETSRTVFSKWFMVLQENSNKDLIKKENKAKERSHNEEAIEAPCAPPSNALLLMRCRSAPAKSWRQERDEVEEEEEDEEQEQEESNDDEDGKQKKENEKKAKQEMEEEKKKKENLVVMRYGTDFYKFSSDIAKETWVVGGVRDPLSRSRSWKR